MRGRYPAGPELIDELIGSVADKERLKAIMDTMYGELRLLQACDQLAIGETRFHQLREIAMQGALTAIAPRPAGRPSRASTSQTEEIRALQQRLQELELALLESQVREEIALILPNARQTAGELKKGRPRRVKIRKSR